MSAQQNPDEHSQSQAPRWKRTVGGAIGGFLIGIFFWLSDPIGVGRAISWIIIAALTLICAAGAALLSARNAERLESILFQMGVTLDFRKRSR